MGAINADSLTALVFAGGRATRMGGVNKALVPLAGRPLIDRVLERLAPQCAAAVISANRDAETFALRGHPVVRDADDDFPGPLAALAAAHAAGVIQTEWVLTAPCDAPFLPEDLARRFAAAQAECLARGEDPDAFTVETAGWPQNTFACLRRKALAEARPFLDRGERKLGLWYAERGAVKVHFDDEAAFANLNSPEDIRDAERRF